MAFWLAVANGTVAVSLGGGVWLAAGVSLGISLGVGESVANDAVSSASAVCTPLGVAVAGMGDGVGGAAQAETTAKNNTVRQRMGRTRDTREL
jgi:hypothetical protein